MMNKVRFDLDTNNDDEFFGDMQRTRNNLGQLFGVTAQLESEQHQTLKYTPPSSKQPPAPTQPQQQTWTTALAKVVNAYKQGESIGKVGVALLHNGAGTCKMIIYKTKANILANLTLNTSGDSGQQLHRQSGYLQFYDDEVHAWSLRFDKEAEGDEFVMKLHDLGVKIQEKAEKIEELPKEHAEAETQPTPTIVLKTPTVQEHVKTREKHTTAPEDSSKTKLITRIAKVGQQLPSFAMQAIVEPPSQTSEYSDSSDTEELVTPATKPSIAPRGTILQPKAQRIAGGTQINAYSSTASSMGTALESQFMQMLLAENRTQNTEVRININKLESKLEKVLDKIEALNSSGNKHKSHEDDEMLELEDKLIAVKKENRRLKQALEAKTSPPPPPPPMSPQRKDELVFDSMLKMYKDDFAALEVKTGEDHDINTIIKSLIEKVRAAQSKCALSEATNEKKLQSSEQLLEEEQQKHAQLIERDVELEQAVTSLQEALQLKDHDYAELQTQHDEKSKIFALQLEQEQSRNEATVKAIMNNLYRNLVAKIESVSGLHKPEILAIIGRTIRAETLKAIEQVKQ